MTPNRVTIAGVEAAVAEVEVPVEHPELVGEVEPSAAGPISEAEARDLREPPRIDLPSWSQLLRFNVRQIEFMFGARRRLGEVFRMSSVVIDGDPTITSHPDHVRSLFTAKPHEAPSLTGESPLRPIVGPSSVLTALGDTHMRQRKMLLPPFHGEAIERYSRMIREATEREIDSWPVGEPIELASRMQAVTLDVIMAGIFGVEGDLEPGSPEERMRRTVVTLTEFSTKPMAQLGELINVRRAEAIGPMKTAIAMLDRATYGIIEARRASGHEGMHDILSLLLDARDEEGEALTDQEVRDQLLSLVLAGHETTANSLAWAWERLVRNPEPHRRLVEAVRDGSESDSAREVEAVIHEAMRSRPVIPLVGRRVQVPWKLGDFRVEAGAPVSMSILLLHHRPDLYPDPFAFRPERWYGRKPGTYEWIPFGGGIRRCLGAALAMAEQRIVLEAMARRLDIAAADPEPERALHRNVTMIPANGARVIVRKRT